MKLCRALVEWVTKAAQSVNRVSREGGRTKEKKTIRQGYSVTPARTEAAVLFCFVLFCFVFQSAFIQF